MSETHAYHTKLGEDGRVVIPAPVRKELGLRPGDTVVVESDGHSLLLTSYDQVLKETQDYFRQFASGTSIVDELIADRRAEAAREDAKTAEWLATHRKP